MSEPLVSAILKCHGLIYLDTPSSAASFWVSFERDTAARARLPVFRADMTREALERDSSPPLDLRVFASYAHRDHDQVQGITDFLSRKRHFKVWMDQAELKTNVDLVQTIQSAIHDYADLGFVVVYWSAAASDSLWVHREIKETVQQGIDIGNRLVVAKLDATPLPPDLPKLEAVQLFGDNERPAAHRVDDLLVRLHWLFYRKRGQSAR